MKTKVLLAASYEMIRQGLRTLLEQDCGLEIVGEANAGLTAVQLARDLLPGIVIMDLALPGLQAPEVVRQISTAAPRASLIVMSIYADRRFVVTMLKMGARGYVLTDGAFEELPRAIHRVEQNQIYLSPGLPEVVIQDYIQDLREREAEFRFIFEEATIGIALMDRGGRIILSNPALGEMLGYSQTELAHREFASLMEPKNTSLDTCWHHDLVGEKGVPSQADKRFVHKNGQEVWGRVTLCPFRSSTGDERLTLGMVEDITNQKQAEKENQDYQEKLRSLASELSLSEERERRRLATDLHDQVIQPLALTQIKLGAIRGSGAAADLTEPVDEVRHLIKHTIHSARALSFELSSPLLYDLGFEAAVEWLIDVIQEQQGVRIQLQVDRNPKPLADDIRIILFQAVREVLIIVTKRYKGNKIRVIIGRERDSLQVKLEKQEMQPEISPTSPQEESWGFTLFSIEERLKHLGGHLKVESEPGRGTRVIMVVPLMD